MASEPIASTGVYLGYRKPADTTRESAHSTETSYTKLMDINNVPNLVGERETTETTTLSEDYSRTYLDTLYAGDALTFEVNFKPEDYLMVQDTLSQKPAIDFCIFFKPNGALHQWRGKISVRQLGFSIGETVHAELSITPMVAPKLSTSKFTIDETNKTISKDGSNQWTATKIVWAD